MSGIGIASVGQRSFSPRGQPKVLIPDFWYLTPENWWAWKDLNFRPHAYQARALTN